MYTRLETFDENTVQSLRALFETVEFTSKNKRLGEGGSANISVYTYSKWKTWNRMQVRNFKSIFDSADVDKSIIGWFLHLPANAGFLDLMTVWVGKSAGTVIAYALEDNQKIWLGGTEITVNKGEGIKFNLSVPHEIKKSNVNQKWSCLMQIG
jgi:hypothetical protein